ncbi:MAG: hypothetical protein JWP85_2322 [Rhodoglobus sp.]|nr:hypothetical protein [Rhodoglobus sp.]
MEKPRVACVGEAMVVLVAEQGDLEHSESFRRGIGGAEANVAIGLASAGIAASFVSRVGDDGFGRHITSALISLGVDTSATEVDADRPTGLYIKEVGATGSRMHYYRSGSAATALSVAQLSALSGAAVVHTTGITAAISASAGDLVLALATDRPAGQLLSFDANWRAALWRGRESEGRALLRQVAAAADIVFLGAEEATVLYDTSDPDEVRRVLASPRHLVVKNDGGAAVAFDGSERAAVSPSAVEISEVIGAGDAFAAGWLAALLTGASSEGRILAGHRLAARALSSTKDHV